MASRSLVDRRLRLLSIPCSLLLLCCWYSAARAQSSSDDILSRSADQLAAILQDANADTFAKAKACQRLAVIGMAQQVPALASLLADENLNVYARSGLEAIPDAAADEALRNAAASLRGRPLVGVIDSIGVRRDKMAIPLLEDFLNHSDAAVVSAAYASLGRIGTPEAALILHDALRKNLGNKETVANACLTCADLLFRDGSDNEALALYQSVFQSDVPEHLRVAAVDGQIRVLNQDAVLPLLLAQLRNEDQEFFEVGLAEARNTPGTKITAAIVKELDEGQLPAERKALLLLALGGRSDPIPLEPAVAAAKSDSNVLREAAVDVLAKRGDASVVDVLLETALPDGEIAALAQEGLIRLTGDGVDQRILEQLDTNDIKRKSLLLEVAGGRRIAAALPAARDAVNHSQQEVRLTGFTALKEIAEFEDLDLLLTRALRDDEDAQTAAARAALSATAKRMSDRDRCATKLAAALDAAPITAQVYVLELLGQLGGDAALSIVAQNAESKVAEMKDAATRVLGEWPDAEAAFPLLEIARTDLEAKYRIRALRGFIRIARQLQVADDQRLEMFHTAMATAQRDDERQLAMDILTRIPSEATLTTAVSYLDQPPLRDAAADAAVTIAGTLSSEQASLVAESMQKVLDSGVKGRTANRARQELNRAQGK